MSGIDDRGRSEGEQFDPALVDRFTDPDTGKLDLWGYLNALPDTEPIPGRGYQLGHKSEMALWLIHEISPHDDVRLQDIDAPLRHFVNSKTVALQAMGLITDSGHHQYRLTALGRDLITSLRLAAGPP